MSMLVLAAVVIILWACGSLFAVSLCWASSRGDERHALAVQETMEQLTAPRDAVLAAVGSV